jgi:hypothetical protein
LVMFAGAATMTVAEPERLHAIGIKAVRTGDIRPTRTRTFIQSLSKVSIAISRSKRLGMG